MSIEKVPWCFKAVSEFAKLQETKEYEEVKNQKSQIRLALNDDHLSLPKNLTRQNNIIYR